MAADLTETEPKPEMEGVFVCMESDMVSCDRKRVTIEGRDIFIIRMRGQYYALDSFCYHAGGPLHEGQIEVWVCWSIDIFKGEGWVYEKVVLSHLADTWPTAIAVTDKYGDNMGFNIRFLADFNDIGQWTCIRCPWHSYKICIDNGEGIYESMNPFKLDEPPVMKSKGVKQRTHAVRLHDGRIYVKLSNLEPGFESDYYNSKEYRDKYALR